MKPYSRMRGLVAGTLTTFGLLLVSATQAIAFTYSLDSTSHSSNATATGASATVDFNFTDIGTGKVQLDLDFVNTTGTLTSGSFGEGATSSKLTGIAFDIFSDITVESYTLTGKLDTFTTDVRFNPFSKQVGTFDIGFADNKKFVGGNPNGALASGESASATVVLHAPQNAVDLRERFRAAFESEGLNIAARFQAVNAGSGSDKLLGGTVDPFNPPPKDIPEPAVVSGLGLMLGFMKVRKKRSSKSSSKGT
ncbi:MAG: PEP-CTERM sorting domain-containing protein [Cyanobacteria bacterium J06554_11]